MKGTRVTGFLRFEPAIFEAIEVATEQLVKLTRDTARKTWMSFNEIILVADPRRATEARYAEELCQLYWQKNRVRSVAADPQIRADTLRRVERLNNHILALDRLNIGQTEAVLKWMISLKDYWTDAASHLLTHVAEDVVERGWQIDLSPVPANATREQAARLAISKFLQAAIDWNVDAILAAHKEMLRVQHQ